MLRMFLISLLLHVCTADIISSKDSSVIWSGIKNGIHIPVNYFYIYVKDSNGNPLQGGLSTRANFFSDSNLSYIDLSDRFDRFSPNISISGH